MKRRKFIGLIGASALSLPFLWGDSNLGTGRRNNRISATANKVPMRLKLPKDVQRVAAELGGQSRKVYLLGGTAAAAAAGLEPPYLNLLVDTAKFPALKQALFEFGVAPLPTPEWPGNLARFMYQDRSYNLVNMKFDSYTRWSVAGQEKGLILFAHSYLMYNINDGFMLDPYDALKSRVDGRRAFLIKPIREPRALLEGFEHYLAATFEGALLGLQPSPEYLELKERVLEATPTDPDVRDIMCQVIDYGPDMLEVAGPDSLNEMLTSPVCVAAARMEMEIDLTKVAAGLRRLRQQGNDVAPRDFIRLMDAELKKKKYGAGATGGLPEYLAMSGRQFRRTGVVHEVFEQKPRIA